MSRWVRAETPTEFYDRCRGFLMASEAEHNLILGLGPGLVSGDHPFGEPIYLAWYEVDGAVAGYAFRTPPFKVGISALPPSAIAPLADDLSRTYDAIPAVLGPERSAHALADAWTARHGGRTVEGMRLRIHALRDVRDDLPAVVGRMRRGTPDDQARTADWLTRFAADTGIRDGDPEAQARTMIEQDRLRFWDTDRTVSMAARAGLTSTAVRVGYVYTPPQERGHGYATALVADLTREVLASGRRSAFLYTDLANPTSNAIYARIGYVPVSDVVDVEIRTAS